MYQIQKYIFSFPPKIFLIFVQIYSNITSFSFRQKIQKTIIILPSWAGRQIFEGILWHFPILDFTKIFVVGVLILVKFGTKVTGNLHLYIYIYMCVCVCVCGPCNLRTEGKERVECIIVYKVLCFVYFYLIFYYVFVML